MGCLVYKSGYALRFHKYLAYFKCEMFCELEKVAEIFLFSNKVIRFPLV